MRAVVLREFGGPGVLEVREIERPTAGPGQILVRVVASGTNPVEAKLRAGKIATSVQPPFVIGYDASGVVEQLAPGVTELVKGDEVYFTPEYTGNAWGTHAEYTVVSAAIVDRKPSTLSHEHAAAVPLAGGTAWEAVVRRLAIRPGETLLVHGGSGGVGSFAVQIAKACGARVLATARTDHLGALEQVGADVCIDYTRADVEDVALRETEGQGVDAVFSTVGGDTIARSVRATRPFGRIAFILPPGGDLTAVYAKNLTLHGVMLTRERQRLRELRRLIDMGKLCPLVSESLPLDQVRAAHERLDEGHGVGKVVLRVAKA